MKGKLVEQPDYTPRRVHKINDPEEKKLAILKATQSIEKKFGSNTILDDEGKAAQHVQALPTGILSLDCAIGIGGYPKGRLIELFGAESSGKTTVALQAVAETQKSGGYVAYIDAENSLDIEYAENLGVKAESLIFAQPDTGEEAFYMINEFVKTGAFDLIIVDSVAALTPASEIDGVSIPGQQAKMMSEQLSKLVSKVNQTKTVIIFINQVRSTMSGLFLNKETTPGGSALKFYSSVRIEVKSGEKIKDGIDTIGKKTTLHTVKNKVSAPYKKPSVINVFGDGFSQEIDVVTLAIQMGIVKKMNEWYSFNGQKLGRGIFSVKEYLTSHQSVFETLKNITRESLQFY